MHILICIYFMHHMHFLFLYMHKMDAYFFDNFLHIFDKFFDKSYHINDKNECLLVNVWVAVMLTNAAKTEGVGLPHDVLDVFLRLLTGTAATPPHSSRVFSHLPGKLMFHSRRWNVQSCIYIKNTPVGPPNIRQFVYSVLNQTVYVLPNIFCSTRHKKHVRSSCLSDSTQK